MRTEWKYMSLKVTEAKNGTMAAVDGGGRTGWYSRHRMQYEGRKAGGNKSLVWSGVGGIAGFRWYRTGANGI